MNENNSVLPPLPRYSSTLSPPPPTRHARTRSGHPWPDLFRPPTVTATSPEAALYYQAEQTGWVLYLEGSTDLAILQAFAKRLGKGAPWDRDLKASDEFLAPLFKAYFERLGLPNLMSKKNSYELAHCVPEAEIDPEIGDKLDAIAAVAESARPAGGG